MLHFSREELAPDLHMWRHDGVASRVLSSRWYIHSFANLDFCDPTSASSFNFDNEVRVHLSLQGQKHLQYSWSLFRKSDWQETEEEKRRGRWECTVVQAWPRNVNVNERRKVSCRVHLQRLHDLLMKYMKERIKILVKTSCNLLFPYGQTNRKIIFRTISLMIFMSGQPTSPILGYTQNTTFIRKHIFLYIMFCILLKHFTILINSNK